MKRHVLALAILMVGLGCESKPSGEVVEPSAEAIYLRPIRYVKELGVIALGSKHDVEFVIENPTSKNWDVVEIQKTCRCVINNQVPRTIRSNASEVVKLTIDAGSKPSDHDRQIRLKCSSGPSEIILEVKTRMRGSVHLIDEELRILKPRPGQEFSATTFLENWTDIKWDLPTAAPRAGWIRASIVESPIPDSQRTKFGLQLKQKWELTVRGSPPNGIVGPFSEAIVVHCFTPRIDKIVAVKGVVSHPITATPAAFVISRPSKAAHDATNIVLQGNLHATASEFTIRSARVENLEGFRVEYHQRSVRDASLKVTRLDAVNRPINGRVIVTFNEEIPELVIPVACSPFSDPCGMRV